MQSARRCLVFVSMAAVGVLLGASASAEAYAFTQGGAPGPGGPATQGTCPPSSGGPVSDAVTYASCATWSVYDDARSFTCVWGGILC